jgi:hypothetical protein
MTSAPYSISIVKSPKDIIAGTLATLIEITGDSFGVFNDWDDPGYDEGTLPTEIMPAILQPRSGC